MSENINASRQGAELAHRSSIGSSNNALSPSIEGGAPQGVAVHLAPDEALVMSNQNGGGDSRGSFSGQHFLYSGGGTGEPISSF